MNPAHDELTEMVCGPRIDWSLPVAAEAAPATREVLARVWYGEFPWQHGDTSDIITADINVE